MMDARNFKVLTETEKTNYIERKRKETELKRLKSDIEYGYTYKLRTTYRHGAYVGRHTLTADEIEKAKKRITELEKELSQVE